VKNALLVLVLLLAAAVPAQAAAPFVPASTKSELRSLLEQFDAQDLAYVPTRGPAHYLFIGFTANQTSTNFRLADSRFPASGPTQRSIFISVDPYHGKLAGCIRGYKRTQRVGGNMIYLRGYTAWRCLRAPSKRLVRIFAESTFVSGKELGLTVGSFKPL
jgi:hypothetical protein